MQDLKKQLQECHEREGDKKEETSHKEKKGKEANKEENTPKELPFTPGVVLHFKCEDTEIQKKDIRVSA
jgi:hypothetical protein